MNNYFKKIKNFNWLFQINLIKLILKTFNNKLIINNLTVLKNN